MTTLARDVLLSSKLAAHELKQAAFAEQNIWRLRWVIIVALLRAVGHVLHFEYPEKHPMYQKINLLWKVKSKEKNFIEFINVARNMTLKEFNFKCIPVHFNLITEDGSQMITEEEGMPLYTEEDIYFEDKFDKTIHQLIQDSIDWWDNYLNEIDAIVSPQ